MKHPNIRKIFLFTFLMLTLSVTGVFAAGDTKDQQQKQKSMIDSIMEKQKEISLKINSAMEGMKQKREDSAQKNRQIRENASEKTRELREKTQDAKMQMEMQQQRMRDNKSTADVTQKLNAEQDRIRYSQEKVRESQQRIDDWQAIQRERVQALQDKTREMNRR